MENLESEIKSLKDEILKKDSLIATLQKELNKSLAEKIQISAQYEYLVRQMPKPGDLKNGLSKVQ